MIINNTVSNIITPNNITNLNFKTIEFIGGINPMAKYKVNLKFKGDGKSFNEIITNTLKIELEKKVFTSC